jgi:hypothetical protein
MARCESDFTECYGNLLVSAAVTRRATGPGPERSNANGQLRELGKIPDGAVHDYPSPAMAGRIAAEVAADQCAVEHAAGIYDQYAALSRRTQCLADQAIIPEAADGRDRALEWSVDSEVPKWRAAYLHRFAELVT